LLPAGVRAQEKAVEALAASYYDFGMTSKLKTISVKLPEEDLRRIPALNRSEFIRDAIAEKLARPKAKDWKPRTAMGKRLWSLRKRFVSEGGELLDAQDIARELRQRRGGLA
jgi:Arc/MetJ-type ribon-helix-helix transcriptional regulator